MHKQPSRLKIDSIYRIARHKKTRRAYIFQMGGYPAISITKCDDIPQIACSRIKDEKIYKIIKLDYSKAVLAHIKEKC